MLRPYKQAERDHIARMVRAAAFALRPDLVALGYDFGADHTGDACINFKLVISDKVAYAGPSPGKGLPLELDFARLRHLEDSIRRIVEPDEYGLESYFSVRSKREFDSRKDPDWKMEAA